MSYTVAWLIALGATMGLAALTYLALKRFKLLAYLVIAVGGFWALWPWEFEEGFLAPLFIVFFYQTFLEAELDPGAVTAFGVLGTICIGLVFLTIFLLQRTARMKKKSV